MSVDSLGNAQFLDTATRRLELRFDADMPAAVREEITPYLREFAWIVPTFVHYIYVCWTETADRNEAMSVTVLEDYRRLNLFVHPGWLSNTERSRAVDVKHELCHAYQQPLVDLVEQLFELLKPDEQMNKLLRELFRAACERTTCDIENMLDRFEMFRE